MTMFMYVQLVLVVGTVTANQVANFPTSTDIQVCKGEADVVLLLDRSGSVGDADYPFLIGFALHLAATFNISEDQVRFGVASYATTAKRESNLDVFGFENFKAKAIQFGRDTEELTNIEAGLIVAKDMLFDTSRGARENAVKLIVVTNDGPANRGSPPQAEADRIHALNISVVSIGIEADVAPPNNVESSGLASSPELYYYIPKYTSLNDTTFLEKVTESVCEVVTVNAPKVQDTETSIPEDTPIGTYIHTIPFEAEELNVPVFTMAPNTNVPFAVGTSDGKITTTQTLDFELVQQYVFLVRLTDTVIPGFFQDIKVTVNITDINDNAPIATQVEYLIRVREDEVFSPATKVLDVLVSDADSGDNGKLAFTIKSGNSEGRFRLENSGGLYLIAQLDRETTAEYELIAFASDKGPTPKVSADIKITIIVLDVNDNPPAFPQSDINLDFPENQALGNLYHAIATDIDDGSNSIIKYTIFSGNEENKFDIDETTGYISLISSFDFESTTSYTLKIKATDSGVVKQYAYLTINIAITNVDEELTINGPYSYQMPENFQKGLNFLTVTASDPDGEAITFKIEEESPFFIGASSGQMVLTGTIDREGPQFIYVLTIKATAGAHTVSTTVTITVTDVNDKVPKFTQTQYSASISEDAALGDTLVLQNSIEAEDEDATSPNNQVKFVFLQNHKDAFKIDSATGVISVNNPSDIDFEQEASFTLFLKVIDEGTPSLQGITTVTVSVGNVNDNSPVFTSSFYSQTISEGTALNVGVLQVRATDADGESLTYSVPAGLSFSINSASGQIYVSKELDIETQEKHTFQVTVSDGKHKVTANVEIKLTDINDVQPDFVLAGPYEFNVNDDVAVGYAVAQLQANDGDKTAPNNVFDITIQSGNNGGAFAIDSKTGILTVKTSLDANLKSVYDMVIRVEDRGILPGSLYKEINVKINVALVNLHAPKFVGGPHVINIDENIASAHIVKLQVEDSDSDDALVFSLTNHNDLFAIDSTGTITSKLAFDSEAQFVYMLKARVTDRGLLFAETTITININDLNDVSPLFITGPSSFPLLKEDKPIGSLLGVYEATDGDRTSPNNLVEYSISGGSGIDVFTIDKVTGELKIAKQLDFETDLDYSLQIRATDKGIPSLYSETSVEIGITNVNEHDPVFNPASYEENVLETQQEAFHVLTVSATDADADSVVTYSIPSGLPFAIDQNGELTLKSLNPGQLPLDYETQTKYEFYITATDNGGRSSTAAVIVNVLDVNDNTPTFVVPSKVVDVSEDEEVNSIVATVSASDPDSGLNGMVTYEIIDGNLEEKFQINQETGDISLVKALNFETTPQYVLTIRATDKGTPKRFTTSGTHGQVTINVIDVNEKPVFPHVSFTEDIPENAKTSSPVIMVTANDPDSGLNKMIEYSIVSGNNGDKFTIDTTTGLITLKNLLDFENVKQYIITVRASDKGTPSLDTTGNDATVTINVIDVNEKPVFDPKEYSSVIPELTTVLSEVVTVTATDPDNGDAGMIVYSIISGDDNGDFSVDEVTGKITVAKTLDFNTKSSYTLTVRATDKGTPVQDSSPMDATVVITLTDDNNNAPIFNPEQYTKTVSESTLVNELIIKVSATDGDTGSNAEIVYSIVDGNINSIFEIDVTTGEIFLAQNLDFESTSSYTLTVLATDKGSPSLQSNPNATVTITVSNVNEHAPVITNLPTMVNIPEGKAPGYNVFKVEATDRDTGDTIVFSISDGPFLIEPLTGMITTTKRLDREDVASYTITVTASDGKLTDQEELTVTVTDINDNAPVFTVKDVKVTVAEDKPVNEEITTVKATDGDIGSNSMIMYSLVNGNAEEKFKINENTGVISIRNNLDFETTTQYTLVVKATDKGPEPMSEKATVTITVTDVNDNKPIFDPVDDITLPEDATPKVITTVHAKDADSGENGNVMYTFVLGNEEGKFSLDMATGELSLIGTLDFEMVKIYKLVIRATDKGTPALTSEPNDAVVNIMVTDINDNDPILNPSDYMKTISEGSTTGSDVVTVVATDADSGDNGKFMFTIEDGNNAEEFSINMDTGVISVAKPLDRETKDSYTLTVKVTDKGENPRLTTGTVVVKISDENDNHPVFQPDQYEESIKEDTASGTTVVTVTATDADIGDNSKIMYSIASGAEKKFGIDMTSGEIILIGTLDYETVTKYTLYVEATDKGDPSLSSSVTVIINVIDVNDNNPIFDPVKYPTTISESANVGYAAVTVTATDIDSGSNGQIMYSITSGNENEIFAIDMTTGLISLAKQVDFETQTMHTLTVRATDKGQPARHSITDATVKVSVTNANDHPPVIQNEPYNPSINENVAIGESVTTIVATDTDGDDIVFSITSTNVPFTIDTATGKITTTGDIDRETKDKYSIAVVASDGKNTDETVVMVTINDENDNSPEVSDISESFPEDQAVNTMLVTVVGTDKDAGLNGQVMYSITNGNDDKVFEIDMNNGNIKLIAPFDFENMKHYSLEITTADKGTPSRVTKSKVDIAITDVNDNSPICVDQTVSIPEDRTAPNGVVTTVTATDADSGSNGEVMFSITNGGQGKFVIHETSGLITVAMALDYETTTQYILTIAVSDKGNPQQSTTCTVTINIEDVNDNYPKFNPDAYMQTILETTAKDSIVETVKATDKDSGSNAVIMYKIVSGNKDATDDGNDDFVINPVTGEISVAGPLDASTPKYILEIAAMDSGTPGKTSQVNAFVTIMITNVNIPPYFTNTPFDKAIPENTPSKTVVNTITASDIDGDKLTFTLATLGTPFVIDPETGILTTSGPLDRENNPEYTLTVNVNDGEATVGNTFVIRVLDFNDNEPVFNQPSYEKTLPEDYLTNQVFLTVEATDIDENENSKIMYTITGGNTENKFEINMNSGEISLRNQLDYETTKSYNLIVTATDKGASPLSTDINVYIYVTDVNDNDPVFDPAVYNATFSENVINGTVCATVVATDADDGENKDIMYTIVGGNQENKFTIDMNTGVITFIDTVDFEVTQMYTLIVKATDKGKEPRSSNPDAIVKITITDENDNAPVFNPMMYEKSVSESEESGFVVDIVKATDADSGTNGMIMFTITAGNEDDKFTIDEISGVISLKNRLDFETTKMYTIKVRATDKGMPAQYSNPDATIKITVTNSNDNTPEIKNEPYAPEIVENVPVGTTVITVVATDADSDTLYFNITTPNVPFTIDHETGVVTTTAMIDREHKESYTFTVVITDGKNTDETTVTVTIKDENDNAPVVPDITKIISEGQPKQSVVVTVEATDEDAGVNSEVMYEIIAGNEDEVFSINMVTGEVTLLKELDFETTTSYTLTIKTTDKGNNPKDTISKVTINVKDENDNKPEAEDLTKSVPEDIKTGEVITTVTGSDKDSGVNAEIMYEITNGDDGHFQINMTTGEIIVVKELDYETVKQYRLTVKITDKGSPSQSTTITVTVDVEDKNDNKPMFVPATYMQTIQETFPISDVVVTVKAEDADSGLNGMIMYAIVGGNKDATNDNVDDFAIDATTGEIKVVSKLDANTPKYVLEISATDKGSNSLTSMPHATVTIMITNVNVPPKFINLPYDKDVMENTPVNTVVQTATATDADDQPLTYAITTPNLPFNINPTTGEISVSQPLDRETTDSYTFTVSVTDSEATVTTTVVFTIKDANDNAPMFTKPTYKKILPEDTLTDQVVVTVEAKDIDIGDNKLFMFSITGGNEEEKFEIDMINGEIKLIKALDFETTQSYELTVMAIDKGNPPQSSYVKVYITVTDINDNLPVFKPATYSKIFPEDVTKGTPVVTVTATDKDSTSNGQIMYTIINGNADDKFEIDMTTGEITFKNTVDYEEKTQYILTIKATDKGDEPKSSNPDAVVTITITDMNDNAPVFNPIMYEKSVSESEESGFVVDTVKATDTDSGSNGMIMYTITAGNEDDKFAIEETNGVVTLKNSLDFESKTYYELTVRATDKGALTKHSNPDATVKIAVTNANDNAPKIKEEPYNPDIYENVNEGTVVTAIIATDSDNDKLTYSITTPNVPFVINEETGVITTNGDIDREATAKYTITVAVSDGKHTVVTVVMITIKDKNDNAPVCGNVSEDVPENRAVGEILATLKAKDEDAGVNAELMYEFTTGNEDNKFAMNMGSGVVTLIEELDFENTTSYTLTVKVTDKGTPSLHTTCIVFAHVKDVNDNDPEAQDITVTIPENRPAPGGEVTQVTASDDDSGVNKELMFMITKGNTEDKFVIDENTGEITVKNTLDYETTKQYILTVTISDKGQPPRSTSIQVTVNILDINDNAPVFVEQSYKQTIPETTALATIVVSVSANDADSGDNSLFKYMIVSGNLDATSDGIPDFRIDENGDIIVASPLDASTPKYVLEVKATDIKGLQSSPNTIVTIYVTNVNVPPRFTNEPFDEKVSEGVGKDTAVKTITATDPDGDKLTFSLITTSVPFEINPSTGVLSTNGHLDREMKPSYTLTVSVNDGMVAVTTTFVVTVTDENDNAPIFPSLSYEETLPENTLTNQVVVSVEASDADEGQNREIMYRITAGNEEGKFEIDMTSGMIYLINPLDFETTTSYSLKVKATDKGTPAKYSVVDVKIYVTDVNDNDPIFEPIMYAATFSESVAVGTEVTKVKATDTDSGQNGEIMYEIISGDATKFYVEMETGKVTVKERVDFETQTSYTLTVRATDKGQPSRHSNPDAIVKITLQDDNDNSPVFVKESYVINIPETTPIETVIVTVEATDKDSGSNGMIMYTIKSGNGALDFTIDMTSGEIKVADKLDVTDINMYNLIVTATDKGQPAKSTDIFVKITVNDVNQSPVITQAPAKDILDNTPIDDVVLNVVASDPDIGTNGQIMYALTESSDEFRIDMNDGKIYVKSALTTATTIQYVLKVKVSDKGNPSLSDTENFIINVIPSNHPPSITPQNPISVRDDTAMGNTITTVIASDSDEGDNGVIMYAITGGNTNEAFSIDMNTGKITLSSRLSAAVQNVYTLIITVTDKGTPSLSTIGSIIINVTPVSKPEFSDMPVKLCVKENLPAGTHVFTAHAVDKDNDPLTYSLAPNTVPFSINPNTGEVKTKASFDRENIDNYSFEIKVSDGTFVVSASISVCVEDENDNGPTVVQPEVGVVCENAKQGKVVISITAFDADLNSTLSYSLSGTGSNFPFSIDNSGHIKLSGAIDFEKKTTYTFDVIVSDGKHKAVVHAKIEICNINEHRPVFKPCMYSVTISSGASVTTQLVTVKATDKDAGRAGMIVYKIVSGDTSLFEVNPITGKVSLKKVIHTDVVKTYTLIVKASDKGLPVLSSKPNARVTIIVKPDPLCTCNLKTLNYPCLQWTLTNIKYKFSGHSIVVKLQKAIEYVQGKINAILKMKQGYIACSNKIKSHVTECKKQYPVMKLLKGFCTCDKHVLTLQTWITSLQKKKASLEKEKAWYTNPKRCECHCKCKCARGHTYYGNYNSWNAGCGCRKGDYSGCNCNCNHYKPRRTRPSYYSYYG